MHPHQDITDLTVFIVAAYSRKRKINAVGFGGIQGFNRVAPLQGILRITRLLADSQAHTPHRQRLRQRRFTERRKGEIEPQAKIIPVPYADIGDPLIGARPVRIQIGFTRFGIIDRIFPAAECHHHGIHAYQLFERIGHRRNGCVRLRQVHVLIHRIPLVINRLIGRQR